MTAVRVAILSRKPSLHSTDRLRAAGIARGHDVARDRLLRCYMNIAARRPRIMYQGQELPPPDAIVPRIGCSHAIYGTAVVRQFQMLGAVAANDAEAILRSHDKLRCLQLLAAEGIELPATGCALARRPVGHVRGSEPGAAGGQVAGRHAGAARSWPRRGRRPGR